MPIGHQHNFMPECDVGDLEFNLVPNSMKISTIYERILGN